MNALTLRLPPYTFAKCTDLIVAMAPRPYGCFLFVLISVRGGTRFGMLAVIPTFSQRRATSADR
ncbi:MAG TPA: hypothetical protein VK620_09620, partial [Bradyrhizobium sp.]|nr:hypothetical protein [Bradyrhizobium sp.]